MQEDKLQQLHREKVRARWGGPPADQQPTCELSVAAYAGDGAAVRQSGAERAEWLQRCCHAEPDQAEGRPPERPAEHLQRALQSQRREFPPPPVMPVRLQRGQLTYKHPHPSLRA